MPVSAIVLAAGESTRMGTQKVVLPYNGKTVIEHIVGELSGAGVDETVVVVGKHAQNVRAALRTTDAIMAENFGYKEGMLSSVRTGLRVVSDDADYALICLGDQPALRSGLVVSLLDAAARQSDQIIVPLYNERRGHPILVPRCYRDTVLERYDDTGLRGLLTEYSDAVTECAVDASWILDDMDRPEDYARELHRLERESAGDD